MAEDEKEESPVSRMRRDAKKEEEDDGDESPVSRMRRSAGSSGKKAKGAPSKGRKAPAGKAEEKPAAQPETPRMKPPASGEPAAPKGEEGAKDEKAVDPEAGQKRGRKSVHELAPDERDKAMKAQLEERAIRTDVVKAPEWETPQDVAGGPAAPTVETIQVPPQPGDPDASEEKADEADEDDDDEEEEEELFPLTEADEQLEYYPVNPPHAYVQVVFNKDEKDTRYRVIEPKLTKDERKVLAFIEDTMVDVLDATPQELEDEGLEEFLVQKFEEIVYDYAIDMGDDEEEEKKVKDKLLYYIYRDFIGEGRIDVMMRDPMIEDISCDGPHQPVFLYHRKHESVKSDVKFRDHEELDSFVIRMAQRAGKHVSISDPILDATMPDGSRLQATLAKEVSAHGSTFTIRKFRDEPFTPPDLVKFGTMSAEMLAYWWLAIQHAASAIYAGGTASGKTTGLNAIMLFIPPQMKIVSIEDTREINLPHPNWIAGITRTGFGPRDDKGRQAGEIDMFQLLKNALRQRPEYIVVGEVRGAEAYNLFQAMATGHAAYGTMHADSVDAVIHRLESDPINIPRSLLSALDVISVQVQARVGGKRVRRTKQLSEIVGLDPHTQEILTNEVFRWVPKDDSFKYSGVSYVLERIQVEQGKTSEDMRRELENRVEIIKYLIRHDIRDFRDVGGIVATYYKDPDEVMEIIRSDRPWRAKKG